ncbi:tetratricopeptide repeat protein [Spirulina subsalsa]|uniref:tetratricopeptide repeat protein n=1 Tax=Spirulina subsalsa TaxID=54311 RepID=UPI0002DFF029|nr:tetratricopeptide repeat protein [Spirulina subsalsa]
MLKEVAEAIERQDYKRATQLLKPLMEQEPDNLWVRFYVGRVQEETGRREMAEKIYRYLLPKTTNFKLISQIRQALQRLEAIAQQEKQAALEQAKSAPGGDNLGVLILEPVPSELKSTVAESFAKIINTDAYTARLQIPSRGWRLYRTGLIGELEYYADCLKASQIPCFALALNRLDLIQVFEVNYFQTVDQSVVVRCQNKEQQEGNFTFDWSEVRQRVDGRIPLFESVVVFDARRNLKRKTQTQDYVPFCDLHIPSRHCILRFCDRNYQFRKGINLETAPETTPHHSPEQETVSHHWKQLTRFLDQHLPDIPLWSDFSTFADSATDFREMLERVPSYVRLERRRPSVWDAAFQLYSGLVFWRDRLTPP